MTTQLALFDSPVQRVKRIVKPNPKPKRTRPADATKSLSYDSCQTPAYALDPLLPYLKPLWRIWEPARGEGMLTDALFKHDFEVFGTDILTGHNFLQWSPVIEWDAQITNPPYSLKYKWIERSYALGKPFALLLPVETIGAKTAQRMMEQHGCEIMLLDSRVNFGMPNRGFEDGKWKSSAQFPVLWFCWKVLPQPIVYGHLKKG